MNAAIEMLIGGIVVLVLMAVGAVGGYKYGVGRTLKDWDVERARQHEKDTSAMVTAQKAYETVLGDMGRTIKHNEEVIHDLQQRIDASNASGRALGVRLAAALSSAASNRAMFEAASDALAQATGRAGRNETLAELSGNAFAECNRNADRLDALNAEIDEQAASLF